MDYRIHVMIYSQICQNLFEADEDEVDILSWKEYVDLLSAAYPSCREEEEEFSTAFYDENDFDPAIFFECQHAMDTPLINSNNHWKKKKIDLFFILFLLISCHMHKYKS